MESQDVESRAAVFDRALRKIVSDHYESTDRPMMLADRGHKLSQDNMASRARPSNLAAYIESKFQGEFAIVRDQQIPARIAICPIDRKESVESTINGKVIAQDDMLLDLPRSILFAFCRRLPPGTRVFQSLTSPFRYVTDPDRDQIDLNNYVEIDPDLRYSKLTIPIKGIPIGRDGEELKTRITKWAKRHNIDISKIRRTVNKGTECQTAIESTSDEDNGIKNSALFRLINAQPEEFRQKFVIPADIIELLMKHH
jgi:hypothetical protein